MVTFGYKLMIKISMNHEVVSIYCRNRVHVFSFGTTGWYRHGPCLWENLCPTGEIERKIKTKHITHALIQISLLDIHPNELKSCVYTKHAHRKHGSFIHNYQILQATKMSFKKWMNKLQYIQNMKRHGGNLNVYY